MSKRRIRQMENMICAVMMGALLCGCSTEKTDYSASDTPVTVYLTEGSSFVDIIDSYNQQVSEDGRKIEYTLFPAEDSENMYQKMTNELLAGEGPDLFYFDSSNPVNLDRLSSQEAFLSIEDIKVPSMISDSAQRGIFPISYQIPLLFTTDKACEKYNIDIEKEILTEEDLDILAGNDVAVLSDPYAVFDVMYESYVDREKEESMFGEAKFRDILERAAMWKTAGNGSDGVYYGVNMEELREISRGSLLFSMTSTFTSPINIVTLYNLVHTQFGEELVLFGIGESENDLKAYACEMVAVNVNSDNQEGAVDFVKYLLSSEVQSCTGEGFRKLSGIPVLDAARADEIEMMTTVPYKENYTDIETGISETLREKYTGLLEQAETVVIRDNLYKYSIFDPLMDSYKKGGISLDTLIEELDKKTELYLKE